MTQLGNKKVVIKAIKAYAMSVVTVFDLVPTDPSNNMWQLQYK